MSNPDHIYAYPIGKVSAFTFDQAVASVFPDMIKRSVPGYATVISMSGQLARQYAQANTNLYDLGCSLGATSFAMASNVSADNCEVIAVDNSKPMLEGFDAILRTKKPHTPIKLVCSDIEKITIENASVVAMNYTLQFVDPDHRLEILQKISEGMNEDGILILSEKIRFADPQINQHFIDLYHDFKRANGYSDLEISQKRDALENVLLPETLSTHKQRLYGAGFSKVETWFQCFNFASLLAFR